MALDGAGDNGKQNTELGAAYSRIDVDAFAEECDDPPRDVEAESSSLPDRFRRKERIEDSATNVSSNSGGVTEYYSTMSTAALDLESSQWLRDLTPSSAARDGAIERLHALLLRVSRTEAARRRAATNFVRTEEIDDLCTQATSDALMAVLAKIETYRGTARFTTWACKFAILEISVRIRRHAWRDRKAESDESIWNRLRDTKPNALRQIENEQLALALQRAVDERLTERQRLVFRDAALDEVPIDVLAERLGTTRGAIYKMLHDARAKLRDALIEAGYGDDLR